MVTENLKKVEEKIEKACERSGRSRSDVTLIAVSKTKPIEMMQEAMQAGVSIFGENKVQEIVKKEVELPKNVEWRKSCPHSFGRFSSSGRADSERI